MKKTIKLASGVAAALLLATAMPVSAVTTPINSNVQLVMERKDSTVMINSPTLTTKLLKPKISGISTDQKYLQVLIYKDGQSKIYYKSGKIRVLNDKWKMTSSKKMPTGKYTVVVTEYKKPNDILAKEVLTIESKNSNSNSSVNSKTGTALKVSPILLLAPGIARAGTSVPISYLQVTNTSSETVILSGFKLKQNGNASDKSVIGLTVTDDKGGSRGIFGGNEGAVVFKNGVADFVTESVFVAGQMRLFTLRAIVSQNVADQIGKELSIDVASITSSKGTLGEFPIRGTIWVIGR